MQSALELLREIKATPKKPPGAMRLSEFATTGLVVRVWSDVLGEEVCFAADNADPAQLPEGVTVYWARELVALWGEDGQVSPEHLRRIHEARRMLDAEVIP